MAAHVMRLRDPAVPALQPVVSNAAPAVIQRCPGCGGTCVGCGGDRDDPLRAIQRKPAGAGSPPVSADLAVAIQRHRGRGEPLSQPVRSFFEPRFGADFGQVRLHTGPAAWRLADAARARAFTVGSDVWLGRGQRAEPSLLLAHELTHVLQQSNASGDPVVQRDPDPRPRDEVTLTFPNGRVERRRVVRICNDGVLHFDPAGNAHMSAFRSIAFEGGVLAPGQVTAGLLERFFEAIGLRSEECAAAPAPPACACDPATRVHYDAETLRFIGSIRLVINRRAAAAGVPRGAVAGAIADEYDTRRGLRAAVDEVQDAIIGSLPEFAIDVDRFFDFNSKLLNTLENDIGPANIKVRTALELVQRGELVVPGSPPSDINVSRIVDFLLTETGTVEATVAVIRRASTLFGSYLGGYPEALAEAVLMEYFKQGESYYQRFQRSRRANPRHQVCPGDDGCQFMHNRGRILAALVPRPGVVRTGGGSSMIVPDVPSWERMTGRRIGVP